MLVKALCLRHLGRRLTADELRQEVPFVGSLTLRDHPNGLNAGKGAQVCLLMPVAGSTDPHVQLFRARVRQIDKRGLVIQGVEEVWRRKECTEHRQALWAWPIAPSELRPRPPDPLDAEDEQFAIR